MSPSGSATGRAPQLPAADRGVQDRRHRPRSRRRLDLQAGRRVPSRRRPAARSVGRAGVCHRPVHQELRSGVPGRSRHRGVRARHVSPREPLLALPDDRGRNLRRDGVGPARLLRLVDSEADQLERSGRDGRGDAHPEVAQQPVLEPVHDPVHGEFLAVRPGVLDDRRLADVDDLLDDVQLAQPVESTLVGKRGELLRVLLSDVHDMPEPVVDEPVPWPSSAARTPPQP